MAASALPGSPPMKIGYLYLGIAIVAEVVATAR
jgi:hypothetical protein